VIPAQESPEATSEELVEVENGACGFFVSAKRGFAYISMVQHAAKMCLLQFIRTSIKVIEKNKYTNIGWKKIIFF
jgi:hypothetical protein